MMSVQVEYVTNTREWRRTADAKAEGVVRWGAFSLQALTRVQIVAFGAVDTGFMLNSVDVAFQGSKKALVFVGADYGHYVNNGTSKMAARPFWDAAISIFRPRFDAAVKAL